MTDCNIKDVNITDHKLLIYSSHLNTLLAVTYLALQLHTA